MKIVNIKITDFSTGKKKTIAVAKVTSAEEIRKALKLRRPSFYKIHRLLKDKFVINSAK